MPDEHTEYGFKWGPIVVERTCHVEGVGYVLEIRTNYKVMQVNISEKGRKITPMPVRQALRVQNKPRKC
jgi:hypothetical protein